MSARERFIKETLEKEGQRMFRNQSAAIEGSLKRKTGHLLSSRRLTVTGGEEMGGILSLQFPVYLRFLDMRRLHRGTTEIMAKRKRKIYNRLVYGAYSSIAQRLMHGFTEEVADAIRKTAQFLQ